MYHVWYGKKIKKKEKRIPTLKILGPLIETHHLFSSALVVLISQTRCEEQDAL